MVDLDIERGRIFVAGGRFLKIGLQAGESGRRNELQQFARNRTDARSRNLLAGEGLPFRSVWVACCRIVNRGWRRAQVARPELGCGDGRAVDVPAPVPGALIVAEEEGAVARDGAADGEAKLVVHCV